MLAKKYRLNLSLEENVLMFEKTKSIIVSSDNYLAYLRKNETGLKISGIVPKNAISLAFYRNKYRRFLYSLIEKAIKNKLLNLNKKADLIIVFKRTFSKNKEVLEKDFSVLLEKINENL